MARQRFGARRLLGDQQLVAPDLVLQRGIFGRKGYVDAARDHRRGRAAKRADMRRGIDPSREPADHRDAFGAEVDGELARKPARRRRGIARADDRDARPPHHRGIAAHDQDRRRAVDFAQQRRIVRFVDKDVPGAKLGDARDLALGEIGGRDADLSPAAATGKVGERGERRFARSETLHQLVPADRPDPRRADQPQPREPLGMGHAASFLPPIRGSVPARSRAIFSRCRHSATSASPASPTA